MTKKIIAFALAIITTFIFASCAVTEVRDTSLSLSCADAQEVSVYNANSLKTDISAGVYIKDGFLCGLSPDMTKSEILSHIKNTSGVSADGVGTGSTVSLTVNGTVSDSAVIAIAGDVDGDGSVNTTDYLALSHSISAAKAASGASAVASDVDCDDLVTSADLLTLGLYIKNEVDSIGLRSEEEIYLYGADYNDFELTGDNKPFFIGRWFDKDINGVPHKVSLNTGAAVYLMTKGATKLYVNFTQITAADTVPFYAYSIDGATPVRARISANTVTLPDDGLHIVRIILDGLYENVGKWKNEIGFALKSITLNAGKIVGIRPTNKVIFYYGDSITEGVSSLKSGSTSSCNSQASAYPWYTSKELGAVSYVCGFGASGVVKPGSFAPFCQAIMNLSSTRAHTDTTMPDLIVINHGFNDNTSYTAEAFESNLRTALGYLQFRYPNVPIVYMIPLNQRRVDAITSIVNDVNPGNYYILPTKGWNLPTTDGVHPTAAGAKTMASKLSAFIIECLGEEFFDGKSVNFID
jgi:lysophospholipase L1-like esterase